MKNYVIQLVHDYICIIINVRESSVNEIICRICRYRHVFHGVFSTKALAEEHVENTDKKYGYGACYIEETDLDSDY